MPETRLPAPPARKPEAEEALEAEALEANDDDRSEAPATTAAQEDEARQEAARLDRPTAAGGPSFHPDGLMGLEPESLVRLLGRPGLIRREAPAEIWQYHAHACVFDIFLYQEEETFRVAYFEARDTAGTRQANEDCLARILEEKAGEPAG